MNDYLCFWKDGEATPAGAALIAWHAELKDATGLRAALRRVEHPDDCAFIPGFHALRLKLGVGTGRVATSLAVAVALAAHVRQHRSGGRLPQRLRGGRDDRPLLSDIRLRRLLAEEDPAEILRLLRRALAMLDGPLDVAEMAQWALRLTSPVTHDRAAREFAYAYYGALSPDERKVAADTDTDTDTAA
ncbi:type I-E CRISPR-associated protein Cse2/CasB [Caenispirillum bisanense]|uniref:CRISPR type I-E/ECOLI-associated protein CasB/Cse2 n=1 Tax=Caenispirillum bisanense TaxID=414052 RepID=A0A286GW66_9PROT|nr:type I-E CRISPR-associated protein Cse2/CasB [Caenispirillum bisanense]SOD99426.1 CRISPR type I-E/ECOLI-associated protein CasB/Cse2 [Caenispirillum bisanense]